MFCEYCGFFIKEKKSFCPICGRITNEEKVEEQKLLYSLSENKKRHYNLKVYGNRVMIEGKFAYLIDKEFINRSSSDVGYLMNYLGTDIIRKGSYKGMILFVISGIFVLLLKPILSHIIPLLIICLLLGLYALMSIKCKIVITFKDKRFCVPKKSMTSVEYSTLIKMLYSLANVQK